MALWGWWFAVILGVCIPLLLPEIWPLSKLCLSATCSVLLMLSGWAWKRYHEPEAVLWNGLLTFLNRVLPYAVLFILTLFYSTCRIQDRLSHRWPEAQAGHAVVLEGWVDDLPRVADYGVRFSFRVTRMQNAKSEKIDGVATSSDGSLLPERVWLNSYFPSLRSFKPVSSEGAEPELDDARRWIPRAGECWKLTVKLKPPHGLMNPHTFDMETWLFSHGFDATGSRTGRSQVNRLEHCSAGWSDKWMQYLQRYRQSLKDHIQQVMGEDSPYIGVLIALVIGDQPAIPDVQWQRFNSTGIGHLISISGFHITFLASVIAALVRFLVVRSPRCMNWAPDRLWKAGSGVMIAAAYVLLAGGGVPAQRTALMMAVMTVGSSLGQSAQRGALFVWSTMGVLWLDTLAPLSVGFWLSCVGVGALMLSGAGRLPDAASLASGGKLDRTWFLDMKKGIHTAFHSQVIATVVLAPMTLYLFGQVSISSFFANALAIPVISFLVTPCALLGTLFPGMDWGLLVAHRIFATLDQVLQWLANNPFFPSVWKGAQPSLWATALATLGLLYGCGLKAWPARFGIAVCAVLPLWVLPHNPVALGAARATILDVGQGLSVLIETAHHRLLYDAGPRPFRATPESQTDAGARVVLPYMRGEGLSSLDMLLISHHDLDHRGGADTLLSQLPIQTLMTSDEVHSFPTKKLETAYIPCMAGQQWVWDDVQFTLLSPSAERLERETKSNDRSCVLRVATAEASILLPGDAERSVEDELVQSSSEWLPATILVAGHHGSKSSSSASWLEKVQPSYTVFTAGYLNHYHHPHPTIVSRVVASGSEALRSDQHGAVIFELPQQGGIMPPFIWRYVAHRVWHSY